MVLNKVSLETLKPELATALTKKADQTVCLYNHKNEFS